MANLQEIREGVIDQVQENLGIVASGSPMAELGLVLEETSGLFQALASCNLLLFMNTDRFRNNLFFSACTRRYYLNRSRIEGNVNSMHLAISRSESFLDALVSRHIGLAFEIARLSPDNWIPDGEYEDDYCYQAFIHQYALHSDNPDIVLLEAALNRFERVLQGVPSPRFQLCRAFYENDAVGFEDAFDELLLSHEQWVHENANFVQYDPVYLLRSRLFLEGIAVLGIAERAGLPRKREYRFCPSIAQLPAESRWPEDIYDEIESIAAGERRLGEMEDE